MHVVQLVPSLTIGGMEVMALHLAGWLRARGISVEALSFEPPDSLAREFLMRDVPVRRMKLLPAVWRAYPLQLLRHLAVRDDVVLHGHMYAWHKGTAVARWRPAACVYTQHGTGDEWIRKEWREMRRSARRTDAAVAVSDEVYRFQVEQLGFNRERTHLVPNGVPDVRVPRVDAVEWGAPVDVAAPLVGMVARLSSPKDPDTLVEAMRIVRETVPRAQLVFMGSGPDEGRLREFIRERNEARFVHVLGERRDVVQLLQHLDVFVLSSRSEGHSIAVLEAMSAGRPIVATSVGGNAQLLDQGACGLLVPAGDTRAMATAVRRLLSDADTARELGAAARRRFLQHFSLDRMGEAYLKIYEEALARRGLN